MNVLQRRPCCGVYVLLFEFGPNILRFTLFPRWHIWKFHSLILHFFITSVLIKDSEAVGLLLSNLQQSRPANLFILRCYPSIVVVFTIVAFYLLQSPNLLDISFLSTNSALDFILKLKNRNVLIQLKFQMSVYFIRFIYTCVERTSFHANCADLRFYHFSNKTSIFQ